MTARTRILAALGLLAAGVAVAAVARPVRAVCDGTDHPWRTESGQRRGVVYGPFRICDPCGLITPLRTTPPDGHPDADPVHLDPAELAELAWLDTDLRGAGL